MELYFIVNLKIKVNKDLILLRNFRMIEQEKVNLLISNNIRELRIKNDDSLQKLGDLLGVSNQQVSKMELGKARVFASQIAVLADYYNVSIEYFYIKKG